MLEEYAKQNGIQYKVVLKFRADFAWVRLPKLTVHPNTISLPEKYGYEGVCDSIAYGEFEAMRKYCSVYETMEFLCTHGSCIHPETLLKDHLACCGLAVEFVKIEYELTEKRF